MISIDTAQLKELVKSACIEAMKELAVAPAIVNTQPAAEEPKKPRAQKVGKEAPAPAAPTAPTTPTQDVATNASVTEDSLRDLCVEVAKKLGSAERIHEILKGFGGKISQIDKAKFPELDKALRMLIETTNEEW